MEKSPAPQALEPDRLAQLMIAYQAGDARSFDGLYSALKGRLFNYLLSLSLNRSLAEDLLQECFLQIHRSRRTYQPGRPVLPWAFAIARHVFLMNRRARLRRQKHESDQDLPEIPIPPNVDQLADRSLIRRALVELPADRREAVLMHHIWGFSFRQIGAVLGIRPGTARVRAHRGLLSLRKELESSTPDGSM